MRFRGTPPVTQFAIAPHAPAEVAEAYANFERVASEFEVAQSTLEDLRVRSKTEVANAHKASAEARVNGTAPPKQGPAEIQAKFDKEVARAEAEVQVLWDATDEVGNTLAHAIAANKDEWLAALDAAEVAATERLRAAIAVARAAVNDLAPARAAPKWLREFSADHARVGTQAQFATGNALLVDYHRAKSEKVVPTFDTYVAPESVLRLLDLVVEPPAEKERTRVLKVAKDSSLNYQPRERGIWG
jgi:hypothetical protein